MCAKDSDNLLKGLFSNQAGKLTLLNVRCLIIQSVVEFFFAGTMGRTDVHHLDLSFHSLYQLAL